MLWQDHSLFHSPAVPVGAQTVGGGCQRVLPPCSSLQPVLRLLSLSRRREPLDAPMLLPDRG